jgi:hypothetical protein
VTAANQGRRHLLWIVPNPALDPSFDWGGLVGYVATVLTPHATNLTVADFLAHTQAKFVYPVWFAAGRSHAAADVPDGTAAMAATGTAVAQNGFRFSPVWVFWDQATRGVKGDKLYQRLTRVVCHEFCHLFGEGHSGVRTDLMYENSALDLPYSVGKLTSARLKTYLS